jgi:hypothetical protein
VRARLLAQPPSSTLECRKSPALQDRALWWDCATKGRKPRFGFGGRGWTALHKKIGKGLPATWCFSQHLTILVKVHHMHKQVPHVTQLGRKRGQRVRDWFGFGSHCGSVWVVRWFVCESQRIRQESDTMGDVSCRNSGRYDFHSIERI